MAILAATYVNPYSGPSPNAEIQRGLLISAAQTSWAAENKYTSLLANNASSDQLAAAKASLDTARQNLNNVSSNNPTTAQTLTTLADNRATAYAALQAAPDSGPAHDAAVAQAAQANSAFTSAAQSAASNGGVIQGAPTTDPGVPVTTMTVTPDQNTAQPDNAADVAPQSSAQSNLDLPVPPIPPATPPTPSESTSSTTVGNASTVQNTTGTVPATAGSTTAQVSVPDQRIRLTPKNMSILSGSTKNNQNSGSLLAPLVVTQGLMFPYTPTIEYTGSANYGTQAVTHSNQDFRYYTNTPSMSITIMGKFSAQTQDEAAYMLACLHFLRSVIKMRFGKSSNAGLPPPVLVLNGYGNGIFYNLPVIVTNFTMPMPDSVDYVKTTSAGITAWVPTYTTISVTCVVQNTPNKMRTFDWDSFATGALLKNGGWS